MLGKKRFYHPPFIRHQSKFLPEFLLSVRQFIMTDSYDCMKYTYETNKDEEDEEAEKQE